MGKFTVKETSINVRGIDVKIRELTHKERTDYIKGAEDKYSLPSRLVALGAVDPKMSEDDWSEEPAEVLDVLSSKIAELSGLGAKKATTEKEPDAGAAV